MDNLGLKFSPINLVIEIGSKSDFFVAEYNSLRQAAVSSLFFILSILKTTPKQVAADTYALVGSAWQPGRCCLASAVRRGTPV